MNKQAIIKHFDRYAPRRSFWFHRNYIYHRQIVEICRLFLNPGSRVLELGCSTGDLLAALNPDVGVGIDISPESIRLAGEQFPHYTWICADVENLPDDTALSEPFDLIILSDLLTYLEDIQATLQSLHQLTHPGTRIVVSVWNWIWQPALLFGERVGIKAPDLRLRQNWLSVSMIENLLELADFEPLERVPGLLVPYDMPPITTVLNSLSRAPLLDRATLLHTVVARPLYDSKGDDTSVTVVIPTRNEVGNIDALVERTPEMGTHTELLFIDGNSTDGTVEKIQEAIAAHPERDIKFMPQVQPTSSDSDAPPNLMLKLGKGDAVRKAFDAASGEIVMILDSDVSVYPEDMPRFYDVLVKGKAEFANGTRFVYPQESEAMRPLNMLGNVFFSQLFSWLLGQRVTDTLCGTKALHKENYLTIAANRDYFGDFDPFGDFDLLFGASWQGYRIKDVPVRYHARTYGESKVRVKMHGPLLGRMSLVALWQLKVRPLIIGGRPNTDVDQTERRFPIGWFIVFLLFVWLLRRSSNRS